MKPLVERIVEADVEQTPFAVAVDNALGGVVDGLVALERCTHRLAAWRVEQVYQVSTFTQLNTTVTTSQGMRSWAQAATGQGFGRGISVTGARSRSSPMPTRSLARLRADVVSDLLLDGVVGDRPEFGIRPSVVVTVTVLATSTRRPTGSPREVVVVGPHPCLKIPPHRVSAELSDDSAKYHRERRISPLACRYD